MSPKPQSPRPIDPRTLPALEPLTHHARWVGWQWVYNVEKDKWTKPPYKVSGANASTTDPSTWSGFDAIWRSNGRFDGLGFNLFECSPTVLAAVDLDKVRNPETGEILPWAKAVAAASYCEITPSGEGLRLLGKATLPPIHRNIKHPQGGHFELYANCKRYITITGDALDAQAPLSDITGVIRELEALGNDHNYSAEDEGPAVEIAIEDLPPAIADLITKGTENGAAPEHRGPAFMKVVGHLYKGGHSYGSVLALLSAHKNGVQGKYLAENRLGKELRRVWGKIEEDGAERLAPLRIVDPRDWHGKPIPERRWIVRDWVPRGVVTSLYGPPGIGKSLLALQLLTATAVERLWLGMLVEPIRSLGVFCEDDDDELHRRQAAINRELFGCDFADLGGMRLLPRLGEDNALMRFGRDGRGEPTGFFDQLAEMAQDLKVELIVIDTIADTFGGNQNDAGQVRMFVQFALARLARIIGGAVLACAHPSRAGQNSGTGESGSVQWDATVRSRLYMSSPIKEDDEPAEPDARVLTRKKANYAARDDAIHLFWHDGVFKTATSGDVDRPDAQTVFLTLLEQMWSEGQWVSHKPKVGNYAPRMFMDRPGRWGYQVADFKRAMQQLFEAREITITEYKTPERKTGERIARLGQAEGDGVVIKGPWTEEF